MPRAANDDDRDSSASSSDAGTTEDEETNSPEPPRPVTKPRTPMTGMGERYVNVEEITDASLAIAFVLAVISALAVGYLVFTAPNKDSPQFQRRDGLDAVKLGVVQDDVA